MNINEACVEAQFAFLLHNEPRQNWYQAESDIMILKRTNLSNILECHVVVWTRIPQKVLREFQAAVYVTSKTAPNTIAVFFAAVFLLQLPL